MNQLKLSAVLLVIVVFMLGFAVGRHYQRLLRGYLGRCGNETLHTIRVGFSTITPMFHSASCTEPGGDSPILHPSGHARDTFSSTLPGIFDHPDYFTLSTSYAQLTRLKFVAVTCYLYLIIYHNFSLYWRVSIFIFLQIQTW